jgi:hypothetical protein
LENLIRAMRISPKYTDAHWKALTFTTEADWQRGVDIFEDRIRRRFLDTIQHFERMEFAGFAVLALDCLLIETLQQFRRGEDETLDGDGRAEFADFLTKTRFGKFFDPNTARKFYWQIRNGILHQGEVKGNARVVIKRSAPVVELTHDGRGIVVNRLRFHREMVQYVDEYVAQLRDPANADLRKKLRRKMNYICRLPPIPD